VRDATLKLDSETVTVTSKKPTNMVQVNYDEITGLG